MSLSDGTSSRSKSRPNDDNFTRPLSKVLSPPIIVCISSYQNLLVNVTTNLIILTLRQAATRTGC